MNVYGTRVIVYHRSTARKAMGRETTNSLPIFNLWPRVEAVIVYEVYSHSARVVRSAQRARRDARDHTLFLNSGKFTRQGTYYI